MYVVAFVSVFGDWLTFDKRTYGLGEEAHLFGVDAVVDVILSVDSMPGGFEDVAQGRAVGGASPGADGDGAIRVDGDEFDVDLERVLDRTLFGQLVLSEGVDCSDVTCHELGIERQVDESRASDFDFVEDILTPQPPLHLWRGGAEDFDQHLGELAGVLAGYFARGHCYVAGEVSMLGVFGVGDFDTDVQNLLWQAALLNELGQGGAKGGGKEGS